MPSSNGPDDGDAQDIPDKCPNCGKKGTFVRDEESGEMVCSNCGFVLSEKEEETGPALSSSEGGAPRMASGPPTSIARPDMGLETVIGRESTDASGTGLSPRRGQRSRGCASGTGGASLTSRPTGA